MVTPVIRPERTDVSVDVRKSVDDVTVTPYKSALVISQLANVVDDKFVLLKSSDTILVEVYVSPCPTTIILMTDVFETAV